MSNLTLYNAAKVVKNVGEVVNDFVSSFNNSIDTKRKRIESDEYLNEYRHLLRVYLT